LIFHFKPTFLGFFNESFIIELKIDSFLIWINKFVQSIKKKNSKAQFYDSSQKYQLFLVSIELRV